MSRPALIVFAKAPEAVINEQRERRDETSRLLGKLEDALARISDQR